MRLEVVHEIEPAQQWVEVKEWASNIKEFIAPAAQGNHYNILWNFVEEGQAITYVAAVERAEAIAQGLLPLGVGKQTHGCVMLPNIPGSPLTWLALAFIGAVIVPINRKYTPRELEYVLSDTDSEYLIIDCELLGGFKSKECSDDRVITIGGASDIGVLFSNVERQDYDKIAYQEAGADDLLNIQYTSRTTGFPEGAMLTQRTWLAPATISASRCINNGVKNIYIATPFGYVDPKWVSVFAIEIRSIVFVYSVPTTKDFLQRLRDNEIHYCIFNRLALKLEPTPLDKVHRLKQVSTFSASAEQCLEIEKRFGVIARESCRSQSTVETQIIMQLLARLRAYQNVCRRKLCANRL